MHLFLVKPSYFLHYPIFAPIFPISPISQYLLTPVFPVAQTNIAGLETPGRKRTARAAAGDGRGPEPGSSPSETAPWGVPGFFQKVAKNRENHKKRMCDFSPFLRAGREIYSLQLTFIFAHSE